MKAKYTEEIKKLESENLRLKNSWDKEIADKNAEIEKLKAELY